MLEEAGQVAAFGPLDELIQATGADRLPEVVESILTECEALQQSCRCKRMVRTSGHPRGPDANGSFGAANQTASFRMAVPSAGGRARCSASWAQRRGVGQPCRT